MSPFIQPDDSNAIVTIHAPGVDVSSAVKRITSRCEHSEFSISNMVARQQFARLTGTVKEARVSVEVTDLRVPLFNGLLNSIKRVFHELVVTYVNQLAARQETVNLDVVTALTNLEREVQDGRLLIYELTHRIERLEAQAARQTDMILKEPGA